MFLTVTVYYTTLVLPSDVRFVTRCTTLSPPTNLLASLARTPHQDRIADQARKGFYTFEYYKEEPFVFVCKSPRGLRNPKF